MNKAALDFVAELTVMYPKVLGSTLGSTPALGKKCNSSVLRLNKPQGLKQVYKLINTEIDRKSVGA